MTPKRGPRGGIIEIEASDVIESGSRCVYGDEKYLFSERIQGEAGINPGSGIKFEFRKAGKTVAGNNCSRGDLKLSGLAEVVGQEPPFD